MGNRIWFVLLGIWLMAALPGTAAAQVQDPGQRLVQAADLARQERFEEAIEVWLAVLDQLTGSDLASTQMKLGVALQQMGRLPESWHYLSLYHSSAWGEGDEAGIEWLREVQDALMPTHVKITLQCQQPNTTLVLSNEGVGGAATGLPVKGASVTWWFLPGKHMLRVEAPGYVSEEVLLDVRSQGDPGTRTIRLTEAGPSGGQGTPPADLGVGVGAPALSADSGDSSRALEWTLLGTGLVLGIAGGILHGVGYYRNEELDSKYSNALNYPDGAVAKSAYDTAFDEDVAPLQVAAYILYGVGGGALVAGLLVWSFSESEGEGEAAVPVIVAPLALPGGGGASMVFEW